jgi:hypothetical protein
MDLGEIQQLASVSDRRQFAEVVSAVKETLLRRLAVEICGDVPVWSGEFGMRQLEAAALKMAAEPFEQFATSGGFMEMREEALGNVIDGDWLAARNEEAVWEAVAGWMQSAVGEVGVCSVVRKIRFPLMREEYLWGHVVAVVGEEDKEWMAGVVAEALRAKVAQWEGAVLEFDDDFDPPPVPLRRADRAPACRGDPP